MNLTYTVVEKAFNDVAAMFGDELIHAGYDEINFPCWQDDPVASAYMKAQSLTPAGLLAEYFGRQQAIIASLPAAAGVKKRRSRGKQPNSKQRQNQAKAKAAGQQQPGKTG